MGLPAALQALAEPAAGLGLSLDSVAVVDHNPAWAGLYAAVHDHVREHLAGFDIEVAHIGSTSVPGLAAKPLLDIAVGARQPIDDAGIVAALEQAGFTYVADLGMYGGLFLTVSSEPNVAVAHLHVVDRDDFQWRWYLAFRDGLRGSLELRTEYSSLKRAAAESNAADRDGYNKAKFDWVLATATALDPAG